jgi:hypothetical protein
VQRKWFDVRECPHTANWCLTIEGVASRLRAMRRWLQDWLRAHPHDQHRVFRLAGRRKLFTEGAVGGSIAASRLQRKIVCYRLFVNLLTIACNVTGSDDTFGSCTKIFTTQVDHCRGCRRPSTIAGLPIISLGSWPRREPAGVATGYCSGPTVVGVSGPKVGPSVS